MKALKTKPECGDCGGTLELAEIIIDFTNCCFIITGSCIVCGEENYVVLSLDDFIEISRLLPPEQSLLGGGNENNN